MSLRRFSVLALAAASLSGCAEAEATTPDARYDVDCSVLAYYFRHVADQKGAPADQRVALRVVEQWYMAKVRLISYQQAQGPDGSVRNPEQILATIKRNPMKMTEGLEACSSRATSDPAFNGFARDLKRRMSGT